MKANGLANSQWWAAPEVRRTQREHKQVKGGNAVMSFNSSEDKQEIHQDSQVTFDPGAGRSVSVPTAP